MRDIAYEPRNVRETLVECKDTSELAVDLAYSAVRFDDPALAAEVGELEARVNYLQYHVRIALMLAARRADEAERLVGLFQVAASAVRITEAAGDVARVATDEGGGVPAAFEAAFPEADERVLRATVAEGTDLAGASLAELELDLAAGVRIIAVRRDDEWLFAPDGDDRLRARDVIVGRGPPEGVEAVYERATGEASPAPEEPPETDDRLERAAEAVVELKDTAELAVGLAYAAARFDSPALAEQVRALEVESDERKAALETWVIEADDAVGSAAELRGLLHLAAASEVVCDAAFDVAELVLRDVELPPVFGDAVADSEEAIAAVAVAPGSDLAGTTIDDLEFEEGTGVVVMAVDRAGDWRFDPDPPTTIEEGDALLVRGPAVGIDRLRYLAGDDGE